MRHHAHSKVNAELRSPISKAKAVSDKAVYDLRLEISEFATRMADAADDLAPHRKVTPAAPRRDAA